MQDLAVGDVRPAGEGAGIDRFDRRLQRPLVGVHPRASRFHFEEDDPGDFLVIEPFEDDEIDRFT